MKTTIELPDDLMRAVKIRAVEENRKLKDMVAELLERGLTREAPAPGSVRNRVRLPLVECAHEAAPGEELTPERLAQVLLDQETLWATEQ
jgi:plasmid stability protein